MWLRNLLSLSSVMMLVRDSSGQVNTAMMAENLNIKFEVVSNLVGGTDYYTGKITLGNDGSAVISKEGWVLYMMSVRMLEPEEKIWMNPEVGYEIPDSDFKVYHINGCMYKLVPTENFQGINSGEEHVINLKMEYWNVAFSDSMPNWYLVGPDDVAHIIASTATEQLESFTGNYDTADQWKRYDFDTYNPWTPEERYQRNLVEDLGYSPNIVVPTPRTFTRSSGNNNIPKPLAGWQIVRCDDEVLNEAKFLQSELNLEVTNQTTLDTDVIILEINKSSATDEEGYKLIVDGTSKSITISAPNSVGVYYGCQTLISILDAAEEEIESMTIEDSPRYGYRGMHVDVARHFVPFEDMVKLIKVMGMYKLNKLHWHLTDDEGWRVEMPWCSYLTDVGAKQCHDLEETTCLLPQFGSRPDGTGRGSGYYTRDEYRSILAIAESHHIEVIPEVDLPGHARAAIKAVESYLKAGKTDAEDIQISEPQDESVYLTEQYYTDNAINPCIDSTYNFINKTVNSFVEYHSDIQPLKTMHLGGDEVGRGAWLNSSKCANNPATASLSPSEIGEYFVIEASKVVNRVNNNLTLGLWEDGAVTHEEKPFNINEIATKEVLVHAWQNVWEWGVSDRAYKLANAGYKVVMSHATHLYFDHPEEPDPSERGFYWATRFANTQKTFGFMPDDLYANIDVTRAGEPLTKEDVDDACGEDGCVQLNDNKKENIIGMQGQIWTETIRNSEQFFHAIFPRLLALAERAWHKADWEDSENERETKRKTDWRNFANTLGYKELARLDKAGIPYRVPVPGVKTMDDNQLQVVSEFPGLEITYSTNDDPFKWSKYYRPININKEVHFQIRSADGARGGRVVTKQQDNSCNLTQLNLIVLLLGLAMALLVG